MAAGSPREDSDDCLDFSVVDSSTVSEQHRERQAWRAAGSASASIYRGSGPMEIVNSTDLRQHLAIEGGGIYSVNYSGRHQRHPQLDDHRRQRAPPRKAAASTAPSARATPTSVNLRQHDRGEQHRGGRPAPSIFESDTLADRAGSPRGSALIEDPTGATIVDSPGIEHLRRRTPLSGGSAADGRPDGDAPSVVGKPGSRQGPTRPASHPTSAGRPAHLRRRGNRQRARRRRLRHGFGRGPRGPRGWRRSGGRPGPGRRAEELGPLLPGARRATDHRHDQARTRFRGPRAPT